MHRFIETLARLFALLGGAVLAALVLMTCVSVTGRGINTALHGELIQSVAPALADALLSTGIGAIRGDFELVEAGLAFAVLAFLPYCQLTGGHASVDIFTSRLSAGTDRGLRLVIEVLFAVVLVVIAVQMFAGMMGKRASGQTTFLLQFPLWWAYALSLTGAMAAALVAVYMALGRVAEVLTGRQLLPEQAETGSEP